MPRLRQPPGGSTRETGRAPEYLEVLARGVRVMECFRDDRKGLSVSDVAKRVGIPRATARRALLTLADLGYVEDQGRTYALTPKVLTLASAFLTSNAVAIVMQPIVESVAREIGEACSAAVLDGDDIVFVARSNPQRIVSVGLEIGYRLPAFSTAVGRVLLGALSDEEIDGRLKRVKPIRYTDRTVTSLAEIRKAIRAARSDGYSAVDQEVELGFRSIAVPVFGADKRAACALHMGTYRVAAPLQDAIGEFVPLLRLAAADAAPMLV
jgi:IclR family pca regulon transcriptional regulator